MTSPLLHYDKSSSYADARARIDRIAAHVAASAQDIIDAHANRDWIALGYESWNELCEVEFRGAVIGLPRAERREAVRQMTEAGMSTRAIGGALGVSEETARLDRLAGAKNLAPDPTPVTGLDGKTYTRPPRPTITVDSETGEIIDGPTPGGLIGDPFAEWTADERRLLDELRAGQTVVLNMRNEVHQRLWLWAEAEGLAVRIDRKSPWGNPFIVGEDGTRQTVIDNYERYYLPLKISLQPQIAGLYGKALGCWCAPEPCHGDVLARRSAEQ